MIAKNWGVHLGAFGLSALIAFQVLVSGEETELQADALVWQAPVEQLERIEYVTADSRLVLEPVTDEAGRYYVATLEQEVEDERHGSTASQTDAGASTGAADTEPARETIRFIAVEAATELGERLATLQAVRALGVVAAERLEDYGLHAEALPRLSVTLRGGVRHLKIGGKAPGDGDVYVQAESDGRVYAVAGHLVRALDAAQSRLMERAPHLWPVEQAQRARLEVGEQSVELVQFPNTPGTWATASAPEEKNETATNWVRKVLRLRVTRYLERPAQQPEVLVRVQYTSEAGKPLGFLELARLPGEEGPSHDYLMRSETTRWWGYVPSSTAEALAQDAASLVH